MSAISVYDIAAFNDRVKYAANVISSGRQTTRSFDTCFGMNDASAVALALYRRKMKRPGTKLADNLYRYINRSSVESDIAEYNYTPELDLDALSASLCIRSSRESIERQVTCLANARSKTRKLICGIRTAQTTGAESIKEEYRAARREAHCIIGQLRKSKRELATLTALIGRSPGFPSEL